LPTADCRLPIETRFLTVAFLPFRFSIGSIAIGFFYFVGFAYFVSCLSSSVAAFEF
jgi:hypothetical protein